MAEDYDTPLSNLIIAGVHKAGTTSLFSYLRKHPEIHASSVKETMFFSSATITGKVDLELYSHYFRDAVGERYRMEASPDYLFFPKVPTLIKETIPDAKIIVILRDPVERLASLYDRAVSNMHLSMSFPDFIEASLRFVEGSSNDYVFTRGLRDGFYAAPIARWHEVFQDQLKIVFFDDLTADSAALMSDLCAWLGLDDSCYRVDDFTVENRTLHYRNKRLHRVIGSVYRRTEPFWRKHDRLKRALRGAYNIVNSGKSREKDSLEGLERLREIYAPHNAALRDFLLRTKCAPLPPWLR